jgi:hypothetical protein
MFVIINNGSGSLLSAGCMQPSQSFELLSLAISKIPSTMFPPRNLKKKTAVDWMVTWWTQAKATAEENGRPTSDGRQRRGSWWRRPGPRAPAPAASKVSIGTCRRERDGPVVVVRVWRARHGRWGRHAAGAGKPRTVVTFRRRKVVAA